MLAINILTTKKQAFSVGSPLESLRRPFHQRRVEATRQCSRTDQVREEPNKIRWNQENLHSLLGKNKNKTNAGKMNESTQTFV
jgi:hypothetical protein